MVDLKTVSPRKKKKIKLKAESIDELLYHFLDELIFLKDKDQLLFSAFTLTIQYTAGTYKLNGEARGEKLNPKKHSLGSDVKAVTKHLFEVKQEGKMWKAKVLLDI